MTGDVTQSQLRCATCGGQTLYDPASRDLACSSCGNHWPIDLPDAHDAGAEFPFDPNADNDPPVTFAGRVHHCDTCGGHVVFTGPALSERCAYCDGPVVLASADTGFATMALIPFSVPREDAQARALDWVGRRIGAPGDLGAHVAKGRFAGLYAPFWTFDSREAITYWAKYRARSGKRTTTRSTSGTLDMTFDDMLVPASPHVTPLIRDGILHEFDPEKLAPFRPEFLSGFAAERHHQTVSEGLDAAQPDKDLLIRNRIKTHIRKPGVHKIRYKTDTTGIHYRRILLPVWILHYDYRGTPKKVVVCGLQGRAFGERPFSLWKLWAYAAAAATATTVFGLVWGAAGLL